MYDHSPHVLDDLLDLLLLGALDHVVGASPLVGRDEVWVVDPGERDHVLHVWPELLLEIDVKHPGPGHGVGQVHVADVPTPKHDIIRVDLNSSMHCQFKIKSRKLGETYPLMMINRLITMGSRLLKGA